MVTTKNGQFNLSYREKSAQELREITGRAMAVVTIEWFSLRRDVYPRECLGSTREV